MIMVLILYHFRCHILKCTTKSVSLLHPIRLHTPPKVTNFNNISILNQYIFRFNISMDKSLFMHVVNATANLNKKVESGVFTQEFFFPYQVEKVAFTRIFQSKIDSLFIFKTCIETTNIFMVQLFLYPDFSDESFLYFITRQTLFLYFLNCNLYSCCFMLCKLNLTIATFAKICLSGLDKL